MPPMVQVGAVYGGRGPAFLGVAYSGLIIVTVLVIGRIYLRYTKDRAEKMHDMSLWLALISWACAVTGTCLLTVAVAHGFGNHTRNLSLPNLQVAIKYLWYGISLATFSTGTSKASVAAFLLAMQGKSTYHRRGAYFLYFMGISNILLNVLAMFTILYCPPQAAPSTTLTDGELYCRDHLFGPVGLTHASWTAFSDFALAVYPIYIVYKLQIAVGIKIYLCILMGLGLIGSGFSFAKLHLLNDLVNSKPTDPMYSIPILVIWGWIELWLVLVALSVPPLWSLVKPCVMRISSMKSNYDNGSIAFMTKEKISDQRSDVTHGRTGIKETTDIMVMTEVPSRHSLNSDHTPMTSTFMV